MENVVKSEPGWIKALEAVYILSPFVGGDDQAKSIISGRMRDGALKVKAEWMSFGYDVGAIPIKRPIVSLDKVGQHYAVSVTPQSEKPLTVSMGFWLGSEDWESDQKRILWYDGIFILTLPPEQGSSQPDAPTLASLPRRWIVSGTRLNEEEIRNIGIPLSSGQPRSSQNSEKQERDVSKDERWNDWIATLAVAIYKGDLKPPITPKALLKFVDDEFAFKGQKTLAKGTLYPAAKQVCKVLTAEHLKDD